VIVIILARLFNQEVLTEPLGKIRLLDQLANLAPKELVKLISHDRVMFSLPTQDLEMLANAIAQELSTRYQVEVLPPAESAPEWVRIAHDLKLRHAGSETGQVDMAVDDDRLPIENPKIRIELKKIRTRNSVKTRRYVYLRWTDKSHADYYLGLVLLEPGKIYQLTRKDGTETQYWSVIGYEPPTQEDTEKEIPEYYSFLVLDSLAPDTFESKRRRYFKFPECMPQFLELWDIHEIIVKAEDLPLEGADSQPSVYETTLFSESLEPDSEIPSVAEFLQHKESRIPTLATISPIPPRSAQSPEESTPSRRIIDLSRATFRAADGTTGEAPIPNSVQSIAVHPNDSAKVLRTFERVAGLSRVRQKKWNLGKAQRGATLKTSDGDIVLDYSVLNNGISSPQFPEVLHQWLQQLFYEAARSTQLSREEISYAREMFSKLKTLRQPDVANTIGAVFDLTNPYRGKR
jgi:hypothetical protein